MGKYNPEYHKAWYLKNRDRLLPLRRANNKKRSASIEGKEADKIRNASPERRKYRKQYKKTKAGKISNKKYQQKPEVKERIKDRRLQLRYGITMFDYLRFCDEQKGLCLICGKPDPIKLHIDHSHITGKVRGLLCGKCNRGIGMFSDDVNLLSKAIKYLNGKIH